MRRQRQFMDGLIAMDVLGISMDMSCNLQALKSAYRKKAKEAHPDKGGSPENFIKVKEAYDSLRYRMKMVNRPRLQPIRVWCGGGGFTWVCSANGSTATATVSL